MNFGIVVLNCQKCNQCLKGQKYHRVFSMGDRWVGIFLAMSPHLSDQMSRSKVSFRVARLVGRF